MENQLVRICQEYSLDEQRENMLVTKFGDLFEISKSWAQTIENIGGKENYDKVELAQAKEARLLLKKKRTEIETIRKILKEAPLREGQAIDKIAKWLTSLIEPTEKLALDIEKSEETKKQKRLLEISETRRSVIFSENLTEFIPANIDFSKIEQVLFDNLFAGAKLQKAAKEQVNKDRIAKEQAEKLEAEKNRFEVERLKLEAEAERKKQAAILERQQAISRENLRIEKEKNDKIQADLKKQADAEMAEKLKLQKEIEDKKSAELLIEKQKIAAEKKAANAPDKQKLIVLSESFKLVKLPELKSDEAKSILQQIEILQSKLVNFILEKSNQL